MNSTYKMFPSTAAVGVNQHMHNDRTSITPIYNAITLNKREMDRVYKNELYIATVSIKHKSVAV